jgi:DNA-binding FrmR family transcriptional regulator
MDKIVQKNICNRLNRAEGQIRALRESVESDIPLDCQNFLIQIKAARAALKRASEQFILEHIHQCDNLPKKERHSRVSEAINILASD